MNCFNSTTIGKTLFLPILAATLFLIQLPAFAHTDKIAILPFEIHSQTDINYLGHGIQQMLTSRLSWKDRVVVEPVNRQEMSNNTPMEQAAVNLGANYVLSGSITEFAGAFSIDATVFKAQTRSIETFYGQAATVEQIIPQLDILAARINHSLFDRKTAALESIKPATPDVETFNTRINPERLMPAPGVSGTSVNSDRPFWKFWGSDERLPHTTDNTPFWKFWKKDSPPADDGFENPLETETVEQDPLAPPEQEKEDKPFWKFW